MCRPSKLSHHCSVSVSSLILTNITWCDQRKNVQITEGLLWSYGSWIYNYLCNQCLSLLTLWDRTPIKRGVLDTTLCDKVCQWLCDRSVVFSTIKLTPRYNWNIVESGVKHHKPTNKITDKCTSIIPSYLKWLLNFLLVHMSPVVSVCLLYLLKWNNLAYFSTPKKN